MQHKIYYKQARKAVYYTRSVQGIKKKNTRESLIPIMLWD